MGVFRINQKEMDIKQLKEIKLALVRELREYVAEHRDELHACEERLERYVADAIAPVKTLLSDDDCVGNLYELLGIRKTLRLMVSYPMNLYRFYSWLRAIEGNWFGGQWHSGGVKFDTPRGAAHVRLMPYQVWAMFGVFAFDHDVDLLDGATDRRRLCSEADLFLTRKNGKTELGAALDFTAFAAMNDANEQVSIVANDAKQAQIAYKAIKSYCWQVDPASTNKFGGKLFKVNATSVNYLPNLPRTACIQVFSAGGTAKDGWNSGWVHNDEPGQGKYVNDHNDMESTVQALVGSAGVRRERMRLNTTTAGKVVTGPYRDHIERVENVLLQEIDLPLGKPATTPDDYNFALLLRLDPWDFNGNVESLNHDYIFRRVNRSIGITVQPTWYAERIHKAITGTEEERKEVLTKDFNIWQSERVNEWLTADEIRKLQTEMRIDDCSEEEGWITFAGLDFSLGNDLHAVSYLSMRETREGVEFFADMDAWISLGGLAETPYKKLYQKWIDNGWLHLSPGKTLEPTLPVQRIAELTDKGVLFAGFGYDPYKAKTPINALAAWLVELTGDTNAPKNYIIPVSQTFASYNPVVEEMDYMVKTEPALIKFSTNPMWPWEFSNCLLSIDERYDNKKPVKRSAFEKVDNVQTLLSALMMYDRAEGRETKQ